MIEYFASLKPIAIWRLEVFRFIRFLYWKLPSPVQSYIRSPANRLLQRIAIDKFAYIYAKAFSIPSPTSLNEFHSEYQPLWDNLLLIISSMPMDDVGGRQPSAQMAEIF